MIAAITIDNVLSGFIGSLLGFTLSLLAGYLSRRREAKDKLCGVLLKLGRRLYFDSDTLKVMDDNYDAVVEACGNYHSHLLSPWGRSKMKSLWYDLIGHDPSTFARHCHSTPERLAAIYSVECILRLIGRGYPKTPKA